MLFRSSPQPQRKRSVGFSAARRKRGAPKLLARSRGSDIPCQCSQIDGQEDGLCQRLSSRPGQAEPLIWVKFAPPGGWPKACFSQKRIFHLAIALGFPRCLRRLYTDSPAREARLNPGADFPTGEQAMESVIAKLLQDFEQGKMNRRQLIQSLSLAAAAAAES